MFKRAHVIETDVSMSDCVTYYVRRMNKDGTSERIGEPCRYYEEALHVARKLNMIYKNRYGSDLVEVNDESIDTE